MHYLQDLVANFSEALNVGSFGDSKEALRYSALVNDLEKLKSSPKSSLTTAAPSPAPKVSVPATDSMLAKDTQAPVPTTKAAATTTPHVRMALKKGIQKNRCVGAPALCLQDAGHKCCACEDRVRRVQFPSTLLHIEPGP